MDLAGDPVTFPAMALGLARFDLAVLAAYLVGVVGLGVYLSRKTRNTEAFTAADRNLPG